MWDGKWEHGRALIKFNMATLRDHKTILMVDHLHTIQII